jgi:hypothetical protein
VRLNFHLPQAMHCSDIALGEVKISIVFSEDVWDHQTIEYNGNLTRQTGNSRLFGYTIAFCFDVLPEAVKRIEEPAEWRKSISLHNMAVIQEVNESRSDQKAEKELKNFHVQFRFECLKVKTFF